MLSSLLQLPTEDWDIRSGYPMHCDPEAPSQGRGGTLQAICPHDALCSLAQSSPGRQGKLAPHDQEQDDGSHPVKTRERRSVNEKKAEKKHRASPAYWGKQSVHHSRDVGQQRLSAPMTGLTGALAPSQPAHRGPFDPDVLRICDEKC